MYLPSRSGGLVRLDNVVRIEEGLAPSRIERLDRQRNVRLSAGVGPGYALGDRVIALRANPTREKPSLAAIVQVPIAHPRNQLETKEHPEYLRLRRELYQYLGHH